MLRRPAAVVAARRLANLLVPPLGRELERASASDVEAAPAA